MSGNASNHEGNGGARRGCGSEVPAHRGWRHGGASAAPRPCIIWRACHSLLFLYANLMILHFCGFSCRHHNKHQRNNGIHHILIIIIYDNAAFKIALLLAKSPKQHLPRNALPAGWRGDMAISAISGDLFASLRNRNCISHRKVIN